MRSERSRKASLRWAIGAAILVHAAAGVLAAQDPLQYGTRDWFSEAGPSQAADVLPVPLTEGQLAPPAADPACYPSSDPPCNSSWFCRQLAEAFQLGFLARGYYLNDQRIEWSGVEETFGAEAVIAPVLRHCAGNWETTLEAELYLNQPFDRNVLATRPELASYQGNWEVDTLEISQLFVSARCEDLYLAVGKMPTLFGRTYFPLLTNARLDAPFIRTESILWRETGVLVRYQPGWLDAEVALVNGCEDRDTNSSKGVISRVGVRTEAFCAGFSVKYHDGIGSVEQKQFKNHVGLDFMLRFGRLTLSGEAIYDEYGFRRPGFDPLDITWGRSIYYRDLHYQRDVPITGIGYYVNLGYEAERWATWLGYGEFYPQQLGHPQHDVVNRRGIVKAACRLCPHLQVYGAVMIENGGYLAQWNRPRKGTFVLAGLQYDL
jgi:hypothetical protein